MNGSVVKNWNFALAGVGVRGEGGLMVRKIEQKGMTFEHDFAYSFPLFSSLLKKEGGRNGE